MFRGTGLATKVSFSSFCLKFWHWFPTAWTWYCYFKARVANRFSICLFIALKPLPADKTCFADAPKRGCASGCAWSAHLACWFSELTKMRSWFSASNTRRKIKLVAGRANTIIASVFFTYLAFVFHKSNLSKVANEVN